MVEYQKALDNLEMDEMIKFTQELIRINSVYDPDVEGANEEKVAKYIYEFLLNEGFEVYIEEVVPGRPNVIAFLRGEEEGKTLLFEGHTDVVSAGDISKWTYDPFGGEIVEVDGKKRIYGRGACDTKQNLAAAIYAVKAIKDSAVKFKGNIMLCIPVDEEGLMIGIKDFIKRGWADNVDAAIICEPEEKNLCIYQKGAIRIGITFEGKMAHGCMPLTGNNPNWAVGKVINELRRLENFEKDRLGKHEYLGWPSITPTMIQTPIKGVAQINVIPTDAYMTLDIRTIPGQEHDAIKRQIQGILNRFKEQYSYGDEKFYAHMEVLDDRPYTVTSQDEPVVKAIAKAYKDVMKDEPIYNGVPGATDGTFLAVEKGIPVIVTGSGDREVPHQVDEWCEIEDIIEISKIYILAALYYLNE
ncbi:M20 family metallopeptidase [Clostridium sp. Cult2]|uniref:M20 family metallopeptidase n=1 Tax=Clostridium sp. Cult2 TaxID=2079003 RepID=UPI001F430723|nr:M20 family metallopeptidase [Clostridium sp. Cult2]MCF6466165.1 peptidase M20 [Clostridium sp. Cult2]